MAEAQPVHFFDLFSDLPGPPRLPRIELLTLTCCTLGPSKSWSHNTLKIRAVLNFKEIPYTQSWISYPDIKPLAISLDLPPNKQGRLYTLPIILHESSITSNPSGAMMDSLNIALHLDKVFPSPPLFPSGDVSYALFIAVAKIMSLLEPGFRPFIIPRVADHLDPRGHKYFHETRSAALGKPLSEVRPTDKNIIDELWNIVEIESVALIRMLKGMEGKEGPFFESHKPGYADLFLACQLAFIERFDKDLFGKFMDLGDGEIAALYNACLPWLEGQGEDRQWSIPPDTSS